MQIDVGWLKVWIGRPRNHGITYDDLVDAETRVVEAEEKLWKTREAVDKALKATWCDNADCVCCGELALAIRAALGGDSDA